MPDDQLLPSISESEALSPREREQIAASAAILDAVLSHEPEGDFEPGLNRIVIVRHGKWQPPKGVSIKPGNIRFNLGALIEVALSGAGVTVSAATTSPIATILAGLLVLKSLFNSLAVSLDQSDAAVLWGIWLLTERGQKATSASIANMIADEIVPVAGRLEVSQSTIEALIPKLIDFGCIEEVEGGYQPIEEVIVKIEGWRP